MVGLVYVEKHQGFGYHMWDEVYINQRWVALDPTWDQTTVDAGHIKLSESSLEGVAPFEAFLPDSESRRQAANRAARAALDQRLRRRDCRVCPTIATV